MTENANNNANAEVDGNQVVSSAKPYCERVRLKNGKVVLHGVSAAARWLGVTPASLSALARGVNAIPITWEVRARTEFPELFG